jgi:hypothetical protein
MWVGGLVFVLVLVFRKSLLSKGGAGFMERAGLASVGVNVLQARLPAIGPIRAKIMQVEREHVRSELDFFEQARGFPDITSFVVNELAAFRVDTSTSARLHFSCWIGLVGQAQLQIEIGALLGRTAAASFTSAVEAPSGKALPVQARSCVHPVLFLFVLCRVAPLGACVSGPREGCQAEGAIPDSGVDGSGCSTLRVVMDARACEVHVAPVRMC